MLNQNEQTRRVDTDSSLLDLDPRHQELWTEAPVRHQNLRFQGYGSPLRPCSQTPFSEAVCLSTSGQEECSPLLIGLFSGTKELKVPSQL